MQPELPKGEWIDRDRQREEGADGARVRADDPDSSSILDLAVPGRSGFDRDPGFQYREMRKRSVPRNFVGDQRQRRARKVREGLGCRDRRRRKGGSRVHRWIKL